MKKLFLILFILVLMLTALKTDENYFKAISFFLVSLLISTITIIQTPVLYGILNPDFNGINKIDTNDALSVGATKLTEGLIFKGKQAITQLPVQQKGLVQFLSLASLYISPILNLLFIAIGIFYLAKGLKKTINLIKTKRGVKANEL